MTRHTIRRFFARRPRKLTKSNAPTRPAVESLEARTLLADLSYAAVDSRPLTLWISGTDVQVIATADPTHALASMALADIVHGVLIAGNAWDVDLTIDRSISSAVSGGVLFD